MPTNDFLTIFNIYANERKLLDCFTPAPYQIKVPAPAEAWLTV